MAQTVIGIFDNSSQAQTAVTQLTTSGISRDRIDISDRSSYNNTTSDRYDDDRDDDSIGGFFRSLFGGDNDDDARKYSTAARHGCVVTVHAQSDDEARRAAELLDDYGAVDVDEQAARYGYTGSSDRLSTAGSSLATGAGITGMPNTSGSTNLTGTTDTDYNRTNINDDFNRNNLDTDYNRTNLDTDFNRTNLDSDRLDSDRSIPIIEENLQVGKREVETGGVRLRSRIIERPVEEHLRLREEHVNVTRNPVNRPVGEGELNTFREGTIEMTEHAEVPVVNKEARVIEEVSLNKEVQERDEVVRDTVRKTEVDVENLNRNNLDTDVRTTLDTDLDDQNRLDLDNDRRRTDLDGDRSTAL
ncbi:MAG: YsnF/AvaK domain-containing protein [Adhaeribacter sp.]